MVVDDTWRRDRVGKGRDAENLYGYSQLKIVEIECLTNLALWRKYSHQQEQLLYEQTKHPSWFVNKVDPPLKTKHPDLDGSLKKEINECYLFHGTDNLPAIKKHGFDLKFVGHRNLFGRGFYFTEASAKADQYSGEIASKS